MRSALDASDIICRSERGVAAGRKRATCLPRREHRGAHGRRPLPNFGFSVKCCASEAPGSVPGGVADSSLPGLTRMDRAMMSDRVRRRRHADIDNDWNLNRLAARAGGGRRRLAKAEGCGDRSAGSGWSPSRPTAEMQVVFVVRDRLVQRRKRCVDQEMVVARVCLVDPGRRDAHLLESELNGEGGRHVSALTRPDDVRMRAGRGGMTNDGRRRLRRNNRRRNGFLACHVNLIRVDGRRVSDVVRVAQEQLQCVRTGRERQFDIGLTRRQNADGFRRSGSACPRAADPYRSGDESVQCSLSSFPRAPLPFRGARNGSWSSNQSPHRP